MSTPPESRFNGPGVTDCTETDVRYLLRLMHDIGTCWSESGGVQQQVWGRHLLEDWRTLELQADRLAQAQLRLDSQPDRSEGHPLATQAG